MLLSLTSFPQKASWLAALSVSVLVGCQQPATTTQTAENPPATAVAPAPAPAPGIPNPVLPGDFPDPSVTKVGDTYWATATSSNWGPIFPLLKSNNLMEWELIGHVFPEKPPGWADYYFWAPEINQDNGRTYVYYSAHKKGGNLAVGVASADQPEGPYRDHGFLVGQPAGSIDGFPMRDEKGQLYLIWKEDGNSVKEPTPIWAQRLNDERTALTGEKTELFRNTAPWEGNLVEGVAMVRHNDYFYAFYAANGCCGSGCTYATGVARARNLLGPWEKYEKNPILAPNETWKCPGHGTVVQHDNRWYLLHHAYAAEGFQNVGRQGVLSEFTWNAQGWPEFTGGSTPATQTANLDQSDITDEFTGPALGLAWQWPVTAKPKFNVVGGKLQLTARPEAAGAVLGQTTYTTDYTATTQLNPSALPAGTQAGLTTVGNVENALALTAGGGKLRLWQLRQGKRETLGEAALPGGKNLTLRVQAQGGNQYRFAYSPDGGQTWQNLPANGAPVDGAFLPPWDLGVRVGVLAQGPGSATVAFDRFTLDNQ